MTGEMTIKCITEDGKEGISVQTCFEGISMQDRLQLMYAVAKALHMEPSLVRLCATLYSTGLADTLFSTESVYDHSERRKGPTHPQPTERPLAFRELDELFKDVLGGSVQ